MKDWLIRTNFCIDTRAARAKRKLNFSEENGGKCLGERKQGERRKEGEEKEWGVGLSSLLARRRPTKRVRKPFYRIKVDGSGRGSGVARRKATPAQASRKSWNYKNFKFSNGLTDDKTRRRRRLVAPRLGWPLSRFFDPRFELRRTSQRRERNWKPPGGKNCFARRIHVPPIPETALYQTTVSTSADNELMIVVASSLKIFPDPFFFFFFLKSWTFDWTFDCHPRRRNNYRFHFENILYDRFVSRGVNFVWRRKMEAHDGWVLKVSPF